MAKKNKNLRYTVWDKDKCICEFKTYKEAKSYKNYQFNQCGVKLVIHRNRV